MAIQLSPQEREDLLHRLSEIVAQREEIHFVYLHGSFVASIPFNDIDIAVYLNPSVVESLTDNATFAYGMELSTELTLALHVPVDVKVLNGAPIGFQHAVFRFGEVIFANDPVFLSDYIEQISREYLDYSHHLTAYLEALIE